MRSARFFLSSEETKLDDCHLNQPPNFKVLQVFYTKVVLQHPGRAPGIFMIAIFAACYSFVSVFLCIRSIAFVRMF
jgi:hypothetical protein